MLATVGEKLCRRCQCVMREQRSRPGRFVCPRCIARRDRERYQRQKNDPDYREKKRALWEAYHERAGEKRSPEGKRKALIRVRTRDILKAGAVKRGPCVVCGSDQSQSHHPDYDKPRLVVWLCFLHHRQLHVDLRRGENLAEVERIHALAVELPSRVKRAA